MRNPTIIGAAALAVALSSTAATAHAQSCTPVDSTLATALIDMKQLVASTEPRDATMRQQLAIPSVDSSTVTVVTDTRICDKVLAAFRASLPVTTPVPSRLFVMKVGTVYVALYPEDTTETDIYRVLSRQYAVLSRWAL